MAEGCVSFKPHISHIKVHYKQLILPLQIFQRQFQHQHKNHKHHKHFFQNWNIKYNFSEYEQLKRQHFNCSLCCTELATAYELTYFVCKYLNCQDHRSTELPLIVNSCSVSCRSQRPAAQKSCKSPISHLHTQEVLQIAQFKGLLPTQAYGLYQVWSQNGFTSNSRRKPGRS